MYVSRCVYRHVHAYRARAMCATAMSLLSSFNAIAIAQRCESCGRTSSDTLKSCASASANRAAMLPSRMRRAVRYLQRRKNTTPVPRRHFGGWVAAPRHTALRRNAPHRAAPHRTALRRTAPHCAAPHRTALHRTQTTVAGDDGKFEGVGYEAGAYVAAFNKSLGDKHKTVASKEWLP